jgi:hypothetical protein
MFSYLTSLLQRFQSKPVRTVALTALIVVIVAVLLGSLVRWLRRRRQDRPESWTGLLVDSIGAVLKLLIGLGALGAMGLHLSFQATEFQRLRGGTSQRNYHAVTTIWGRPHVQRELSVRLTYDTTHFYDKDGLEIDPARLEAATQPVGFRKKTVEHTIPGNPIARADHEFVLRTNYRRKGGAWYPGFETDATFSYRIENFADREAMAQFHFPLPAGQGLVDRIRVVLDGKTVEQKLLINEAGIRWNMPIPQGGKHELILQYHSRGLEYLRFEPGSARELESYRLRMVCRGIRAEQINYPVGCMTPTEKIAEKTDKDAAGRPVTVTTLAWNLDRALTRLGMGVIIPRRKQPGYYVARVLAAAPWGLLLLLAMVLVTYAATRRMPHWLPLALLAVAYHLYYLLMAHVGDYAPGLVGGMIISGVVLTGLMAAFQLLFCRRFHAVATLALFGVFAVVYPLIRISGCEGLLLTILYVVLLAYVIALLIRFRRPRVPADGEPPSPASPDDG